MTESLKVDIDQLHSLSTSLGRAETDLSYADFFSHQIAELVGHPELAERCRDFSKGWNDKRQDVLERVTGMKSTVSKIADAFADLESNLARGIAQGGSGASASSASRGDGR